MIASLIVQLQQTKCQSNLLLHAEQNKKAVSIVRIVDLFRAVVDPKSGEQERRTKRKMR